MVWGGKTPTPVPGGARAVPCLAAGPVLCWQQGWGLSAAPLACPCPAQPRSVLQSLAGRAAAGWQRPALGSTPLRRQHHCRGGTRLPGQERGVAETRRGGQGVPGGPEGQGGQSVQSGRADAQRVRESREAAAAARRALGPTAASGCLPSAPRRGDPQLGPGDAATGSGYGTPCTCTACKNQPPTACKTRSGERAYLCKLASRQGGEQGGEERWGNSGQFSAREPRNTRKLREGLPGEEMTAIKTPATLRLPPAREGKHGGTRPCGTTLFSGTILA